ncbi:MAG: hypothetical protein RMM06_10460 [Armatimonadota bacterium]|nr:hypothetical protein [bacterium]MDW8291137.1 hypothetical protein [Armatimonadota bacterium]
MLAKWGLSNTPTQQRRVLHKGLTLETIRSTFPRLESGEIVHRTVPPPTGTSPPQDILRIHGLPNPSEPEVYHPL